MTQKHYLEKQAFGKKSAEETSIAILKQLKAEILKLEEQKATHESIKKDLLKAFDNEDYDKIFDIARSYRA